MSSEQDMQFVRHLFNIVLTAGVVQHHMRYGMRAVNNETEFIWHKLIVTYFKVRSQYLHGRNEKPTEHVG